MRTAYIPSPATTLPLVKRRANPALDFYRTPAFATTELLKRELFIGRIWEPACGDGAISKVLEMKGHSVRSTDIVYRGYGSGGLDFLRTRTRCKNIITNPPFCLAEEFVRAAVTRATCKAAFLLRLAFLEGKRRQALFARMPPARVWVFSNRLTMHRDGEVPQGSGHIAFAWFVWDHACTKTTTLGWI
jgi:hypothetical protein